ncbi:MAG: fibronectin type III domain-containing protein, partial [bacterium]
TDNGSTWNIIASDLDNTGSYTWLIPTVDSTNCLVKVTARDLLNNETSVQSASTFTIDSTDPVISNLTATPSADISSTRPTTITALTSEPCTWTVIVHRGGTPTSPIVATLTQGLSTSLNLVWTPSPSEPDGTHLIEVQAVDRVSRSTTSSLTVEVYNHSIKITGLRILDWTGTPTDTFHPGGYYAVEITVKNLESSSLNALVVIRSKDPTNTLLHLGAFNVSLNAGEERCLGAVGFVLPPDALTGNWTVESFVWNHWVSQPGWASLSSTVRAYFQVVP